MKDIMDIIAEEMLRSPSQSAYLNNFYMKLPDSAYEHGSYYRNLLVEIGWINLTPLEFEPRLESGEQQIYSDLYLNKKAGDFLDTIERALIEEGISIDEVKRLQQLSKKDFNKIKELHELVFPAYVRLRRMGYTLFDLIG